MWELKRMRGMNVKDEHRVSSGADLPHSTLGTCRLSPQQKFRVEAGGYNGFTWQWHQCVAWTGRKTAAKRKVTGSVRSWCFQRRPPPLNRTEALFVRRYGAQLYQFRAKPVTAERNCTHALLHVSEFSRQCYNPWEMMMLMLGIDGPETAGAHTHTHSHSHLHSHTLPVGSHVCKATILLLLHRRHESRVGHFAKLTMLFVLCGLLRRRRSLQGH